MFHYASTAMTLIFASVTQLQPSTARWRTQDPAPLDAADDACGRPQLGATPLTPCASGPPPATGPSVCPTLRSQTHPRRKSGLPPTLICRSSTTCFVSAAIGRNLSTSSSRWSSASWSALACRESNSATLKTSLPTASPISVSVTSRHS